MFTLHWIYHKNLRRCVNRTLCSARLCNCWKTRKFMTPPPPIRPVEQVATINLPPPTLADWRGVVRALRTPETPRPTFAGLDHEDPLNFLNECKTYFTESSVTPQQWTRLVAKSLTDNAAKWWDLYKNLSLPWAKFRDLLIQHYAGKTTLMRLQAKLYSSKQSEKEPVGIFLQQKYLLALRLRPEAPEAGILALLASRGRRFWGKSAKRNEGKSKEIDYHFSRTTFVARYSSFYAFRYSAMPTLPRNALALGLPSIAPGISK